jgi:hypothetical protein
LNSFGETQAFEIFVEVLKTKKIVLKIEEPRPEEVIAKFALRVKFDNFFAGSIYRKGTYPFGHSRFARTSKPAEKGWI